MMNVKTCLTWFNLTNLKYRDFNLLVITTHLTCDSVQGAFTLLVIESKCVGILQCENMGPNSANVCIFIGNM